MLLYQDIEFLRLQWFGGRAPARPTLTLLVRRGYHFSGRGLRRMILLRSASI